MKKIIDYFKTSPLKKSDIIIRFGSLAVLGFFFITGGAYMLATNPRDIGTISFIAVGAILLFAGIWMINPPAMEKWLRGE